MFTLFFVVLGASAAIFGGWLERAGPRKAGFVAALCWGGGLGSAALGVSLHQLWIMWLGLGVIGGVGLGLGYISPVSTLVKWFPDRRGMATGMAIMGFGGGAMIGSPLANLLMNNFRTADSVGVWQTMATLGAIYFVFMMARRARLSRPAAGWRPAGWTPPARSGRDDHPWRRPSRRRPPDAAVLARLGGALPQRLGRHRRPRDGLADVPGDLRRFADRSPRDRLRRARRGDRRPRSRRSRRGSSAFSRCSTSPAGSSGRRCPTGSAARRPISSSSCLGILLYARCADRSRMGRLAAVRRALLRHPVDVRRRLRDRARLSRRPFRRALSSARSTDGCSPPGRRPGFVGPVWSTTSTTRGSPTGVPREHVYDAHLLRADRPSRRRPRRQRARSGRSPRDGSPRLPGEHERRIAAARTSSFGIGYGGF